MNLRLALILLALPAPGLWAENPGLVVSDYDEEENTQADPPAVRRMIPSPALSAEEEMRAFKVPAGFHVELVAAEPLVHDPVAAAFDREGNRWVAELSDFDFDLIHYLPALAGGAKESEVPKCKIVKLESSHHDGHYDRRTVWLDGLEMARGIAIVHDGVLVSDTPNLWLARDLHGTGRCDDKKLLATGFETMVLPQVTDNQKVWAFKPSAEDMSRTYYQVEESGSLMWGRDNILHDIHLDFDFRYRHGEVTPVPVRGEFGLTQDDFGRIFFNDSTSHFDGDFFAATYGLRNPDASAAPWSNTHVATNPEVWPGHLTAGRDRRLPQG